MSLAESTPPALAHLGDDTVSEPASEEVFFDAREGSNILKTKAASDRKDKTKSTYTSLTNLAGLYFPTNEGEQISKGSMVSSLSSTFSQDIGHEVNISSEAEIEGNASQGSGEVDAGLQLSPRGPPNGIAMNGVSLSASLKAQGHSQRPSGSGSSHHPHQNIQQTLGLNDNYKFRDAVNGGAVLDTSSINISLAPSPAPAARNSDASYLSAMQNSVSSNNSAEADLSARARDRDRDRYREVASSSGDVDSEQSTTQLPPLERPLTVANLTIVDAILGYQKGGSQGKPTAAASASASASAAASSMSSSAVFGINGSSFISNASIGNTSPPAAAAAAAAKDKYNNTKAAAAGTAGKRIYVGEAVNVASVNMDSADVRFKDHTRLLQTINFHVGAIWTMKFSPDGKYLATGGQDCRVVVWNIGVPPPPSGSVSRRGDSDVSESELSSSNSHDDVGSPRLHVHTSSGSADSGLGGVGVGGVGVGGGGGGGGGGSAGVQKPLSGGSSSSHRERKGSKKSASAYSPRQREGSSSSGDVNNTATATAAAATAAHPPISPFLWPTPIRIFQGHTKDIIDISWSKSNFILSASADNNVRLWHVTREDCLQFFRHPDIVSSIDFHPTQDRFFISGCVDRRLRVWDIIPDANIKEWVSLNEKVTSVSFSPDGLTVAVGLMNGQVYFYNYEGLKYITQMTCRNRRGKFKAGTKVTGLSFLKNEVAQQAVAGNQRRLLPPLLVTTNDNRLRLFSLNDFSMKCKYKGLKNAVMQIKSTFSEDGKYIICGSENGAVHVWHTEIKPSSFFCGGTAADQGDRSTSYESFQCTSGHEVAAVVAVFAPSSAIQHSATCSRMDYYSSMPSSPYNNTQHSRPFGGTSNAFQDSNNHSNTSTSQNSPRNRNEADRRSELSANSISGSAFCSNSDLLGPQISDLNSRVIVTADFEGCIRVFVRTS